ncbi:MAG: hypothetical protein CXT72_00105 [Methanobacteriota archaeon]|nr:MAG: hypothetical protein CXT72_00105 [Euryarchaeota archaeon]HIE63902.1 hypothetical protein [Candidatus Poseidoniales archaeon]HIK99470.1 hypothetical protein [Candidatus Poseidoniales archaeon]
MATQGVPIEKIQRKALPEFEETESGVIEGVREAGLFNVALNDVNQYGPHAMIAVLGIIAIITGLCLGIAMIVF